MDKRAGMWGADADRWNAREEDTRNRDVKGGLRTRFNELLSTMHIGPNETLRQYLMRNPITNIIRPTTRAMMLMRNQLFTDLKKTLDTQYTPEQIEQFKRQYGENPQDWIEKKVVAKKAVLFTRKKKAKLFQR